MPHNQDLRNQTFQDLSVLTEYVFLWESIRYKDQLKTPLGGNPLKVPLDQMIPIRHVNVEWICKIHISDNI